MHILKSILSVFNIGFIVAKSIPKMLVNRSKAVKAFKEELTSMGLDKDVIDILAKDYKNTINLKNFKTKEPKQPKEKRFIYKKERISQSV